MTLGAHRRSSVEVNVENHTGARKGRGLMKRRSFVGRVAGALAAAWPTRAGAQQLLLETPRHRAVAAARIINTAQAAYHRKGKFYLPLAKLVTLDITERLLMKAPVLDVGAAIVGGEALPGSKLSLDVRTDGRGYTLLISDVDGFAYKTDHNGVIYEGSLEPLRQAFVGEPIQPRKHTATGQPSSPLSRIAESVWGFLLPVAHADGCCDYCNGFCIGPGYCPDMCNPGLCCNIGFGSCTWCCTARLDCFTCWTGCSCC